MEDVYVKHLDEYKQNGFTVFPCLFTEDQIQKWRMKHQQLQDEGINTHGPARSWWFGNMLEFAPTLMLPAVANPVLLDFLELVMGPFVQLDNLTLAAFPSWSTNEVAGKVSGWHRDRWAQVPRSDAFERPLAINAISYLQDLTDEFGPLRVIPGSHRKPIVMAPEERTRPRPDEVLVYAKAGDAIVTHNGLIHSGTPNTSGQTRYFFSIYYNMTWLKHTDNHSGPNVQKLLQEARARNDHRLMRLLGVDEQLQARCNSGFLQSDEERWAEWAASDREVLVRDEQEVNAT